jgi:hypothetical protein
VQETTKPPQRPPQKQPQKTEPLIFKGFMVFVVVIVVWHKYIELLRVLPAKIVPTGGAVGGLERYLFGANPKNPKKSLKCLIFNGLSFCGGLCGGFVVS